MKFFSIVFCLLLSLSSWADGKPRYSLSSSELIGEYEAIADVGCIDGLDVCYESSILKKDGKLVIYFGASDYYEYSDKIFRLRKTKNGVLVFTGGGFNDDCDNPGCANVLSISGVVYPKKIDGIWVPQVKANIELECGAPEDGGCDGEEEYKYTVRMRKG